MIHQALPHDSAALHVSGEARYVDDLPEPPGTLYAAFGMSSEAHARILALDLAPVRAAEGVVAVLTAADIPGANNIGPVVADEPVLATDVVQFRGQPIFAVAATSVELARRAARLARIEYQRLDPVVTIEQALEASQFVLPSVTCERGSVASLPGAANRIRGRLRCGAQEHFYLEGQVALAIPGERGEMLVHSSTQHPSEIQHLVAAALGIPDAAVTVELRRLGGAFGGKETQAAVYAV
ncbi:MAG TPA: molybdopterin cofactor-binding domain-containing protein, partial [Burkholderiales bacterium]